MPKKGKLRDERNAEDFFFSHWYKYFKLAVNNPLLKGKKKKKPSW